MSCERFDDKTVWVLSGLYRKVLGRTRVNEKTCLGCHTREIKCYEKISQEKNKKNGYCSQECQIGYYSLIYDMGQKRVREQARERPDFRQLLEMLDEPVIAQIITYTYPLYREEIGDMRAILDLRGESQQLRDLIDRQILREIRELSPEIEIGRAHV